MKKLAIAVTVLATAMILVGSAALYFGRPTTAEGGVMIANPWTETDVQGVLDAVGMTFGIPEGARDIGYSLLRDERLAEMRFTWDGMDYVARIKPAAGFEDISGLYFDPWDIEEACEVRQCEGVVRRTRDGGQTVDLCLWYDAGAGIMYSVTAGGEDLDGFDIQAAAEQLYAPAEDGVD